MRYIMKSFRVVPFSMGCISKSTTGAIESKQWNRQYPQTKQLVTRVQDRKSSSEMKLKNSWGLVTLRRSNITRGLRRLILDTFQSFSQIIYHKDVETEIQLEIGFPTDVKHVTHIGYDGSMTTNPVKNWDNIETPELHSFPAISLKQFEDAMTAQLETPPGLHPPKCI